MTEFHKGPAARAALLYAQEMGQADSLAVETGMPSLGLMENAGKAIAEALLTAMEPRKVLVLTGPGNNGGDGFVAARILRKAGWRVSVGCLRDVSELKGDAAEMAQLWNGHVRRAMPDLVEGYDAVIDAMFGTGLKGPLEGKVAAMIDAVNASGAYVVSADIPSGVNSDTGEVMGTAVYAHETVTFFRPKPGHVLMPGKALCGKLHITDIGIPEEVLETVRPQLFHNTPHLWGTEFPRPDWRAHKYDRGAALVVSGGAMQTGAPRLAARGALRAGAGLVTVACPASAAMIHAAQLTAIMLQTFETPEHLLRIVEERKIKAVVAGPALGVNARTREMVLALLEKKDLAVVLDADAITVFKDDPGSLLDACHERVVLTPHQGEFERLFPGLLKKWPNRIDAAREAAKKAGATVLFKGPGTVVAHSGGRLAALTSNAPPSLATAGSGDVLAGIIAGLMAQGMDGFMAANAGAWLHGDAAERFGPGLIAEDLAEALPQALTALEQDHLEPAPLPLAPH